MSNLEDLFNNLNIVEDNQESKMSQEEIQTLINRAFFAATQNQTRTFNEKIEKLNQKLKTFK